jgi:hypothetical protein
MCNYEYKKLIDKWNDILNKITLVGGKTRKLIIEAPATEEEIIEKEKRLGFSLPQTFREVLLNFSKHIELSWYFPNETNLPNEFREIFSGEIGWSLEWVEDLNELAKELEYVHEYEESELRNKLQFYQVSNGDILAFDMINKNRESIVYWSHEGEGVFTLADSFISYIEKITDLNCVGSEIWQLESFLDDKGLNTDSLEATYWKEWFIRFTTLSFEEASKTLDTLLEFIEYHGQLGDKEKNALNNFDKTLVFEKILSRLEQLNYSEKEILYKILGEVLGSYISIWVKSLWEKESKINPLRRTYLTAMCISKEEALHIVLPYIEKKLNAGGYVYEAVNHLAYLNNNKIINWIKAYVPVTKNNDQWAILLASSSPYWSDIREWFTMGGKYKKIVVIALKHMVESWTSDYIKGNLKIADKPDKQEVIKCLESFKESEILNTKKDVYDEIINNIDLIL